MTGFLFSLYFTICFYLFNIFTFYPEFLPPFQMQQNHHQTLALIPKGMLWFRWVNGFERSIFTHLLRSGERPQYPRLNSVILRYQIGTSSEQSLLCHATLPFSSLPPWSIRALAKERGRGVGKKMLTGFQLFSCLFLPGLMLLEWGPLCWLNLLCSAI